MSTDFERITIPIDTDIQTLYDNLLHFHSTGEYLNEAEIEYIVRNYYGIPHNDSYNAVILSPYIIAMAIQDNINKNRELLLALHKVFLQSEEQKIAITYIQPKSKYYILRHIDYNSNLPRKDYIFNKTAYVHIEDQPFLLSKHSSNEEAYDFCEFNNLNNDELKLCTALSLLSARSCKTYYIKAMSKHQIPIDNATIQDSLTAIEIDKIRLIVKLIARLNHMGTKYKLIGNTNIPFYEEQEFKGRIVKYLSNFDDSNEVLKRSSYMLYKATVLFHDESYLFAEEAYMLMTIGLEGIFKLLCIKELGDFEIKKATDYISKQFGVYFAERLIEIYTLRTELVHPQNGYNVEWKKDISHDDFMEDLDIARALLYYYVTGEMLEIKSEW